MAKICIDLLRQATRQLYGAAVGLILIVILTAPQAQAQSLENFINDAGRVIGSTVKSAGSALSKAAEKLNQKPKSKRGQRKDLEARQTAIATPPLPQRRPRNFADENSTAAKIVETPKSQGPDLRPTIAANTEAVQQNSRKSKAAENLTATRSVPPPEKRPRGIKKKAPAPDVFSDAEIKAAQARCRALLKTIAAETIAQKPIKKGPCGDPAPVKLKSLGANPKVAISPPATVNCQMVKALHTWLVQDLQPLSRAYFKSPITKIENMSSYSCRNAYGRTSTKLSEHGKANALDIRGFAVKSVKVARLLQHWGPTKRDIEAAKKMVAEREAKRREAEAARKAKANDKGKPSAVAEKGSLNSGSNPVQKAKVDSKPVVQKLGGPNEKSKKKKISAIKEHELPIDLAATRTPKARFLREAHKRACKIFGTVLGPEANKAHRNHFHVDLAPRKYRNYCR